MALCCVHNLSMSFVGKWFGFGRDERYDRGLRAYEAKDYAEAAHWLEQCLQDCRDSTMRHAARAQLAMALAQLGRLAMKAENFEEAAGFYSRAVEVQPNYADLRLSLAIALRNCGRLEEEAEQIARALSINPEYPMAVLHQGLLLYSHRKFEQGMARISEAVNLDARFDRNLFERGLNAHQAGDTELAGQLFAKLTTDVTNDANRIASEAESKAKQLKWQEAEELYRRALSLSPNYADVHVRYGEVLLELNLVEEALGAFRTATSINPRYAAAYALAGVALRRLGREDEALAAFHTAAKLDPKNPIAQRELDRPRR